MFEVVQRFAGNENIKLPIRKTTAAAGYDFAVAEDIVIPSYWHLFETLIRKNGFRLDVATLDQMAELTKSENLRPTLVPTGIKCRLPQEYYLQLSIRSSSPLKYWLILANGTGIIDADYCDNESNDGEIFFQVINLSPIDIQLKAGDIIGQGIVTHYYRFEDEPTEGQITREGGFGSTNG